MNQHPPVARAKGLQQTYDTIAEDYGDGIAIINAFHSRFYIRHTPQNKGSVLDIGCGTGDILARLSAKFAHSFGVDPIQKFVTAAKQRAPRAHSIVGVAEDLPFEDETMDYIISHVAFQHADRERALCEALRVLRPGGRLIIAEALSKKAPGPLPGVELYRRLRFNYFLISHYGMKRAKRAKAYRTSSDWKELTDIHRSRRFDFEQLWVFYAKQLPGAVFKRLEPKIIAVVWDKPIA